jgi:serine protease
MTRTVLAAAALSALTICAGPLGSEALAARAPSARRAELIVKYRPGTTAAERRETRHAAGVRSAGAISDSSQVVTINRGSAHTSSMGTRLRSDPHVEYALPNYVASTSAFMPNDPGRDGPGHWTHVQWNFLDPFGIRVLGAWENAIASGRPGGKGVVVAVLDTGVAYRTTRKHKFRKAPDLARRRFVRGHDFVRHNPFPYDRNGHGTFIAGTIGQATNNGIGVTGVAYQAKIMPVRVLDFEGKGDVSTIARGIRFAARHGAQVINMSFEFDIGLTAAQIPDVISAIRYAHRKGALLVAAAGNAEDTRVAYPALAKNVVGVGATTEHGCLAEYSNTGFGLDLMAPGGGADANVEGDPDCQGPDITGRDVFQYTFTGLSFRRFGLPGGYEGTSMAVPHVSGTAALILASGVLGNNPSPEALTDRLERTARDLGTPGFDSVYGWGLLDATAATTRPAPPPVATPAAR